MYLSLGINNPSVFAYYSTITSLWQFTLGGLGYLSFKTKEISSRRTRYAVGLLCILIYSYCLFNSEAFNRIFNTVVICLLTFFVLIYKLVDTLPIKLLNIFKWIGYRSYSIYLYHLPILYLAEYSAATKIFGLKNKILSTSVAIILIVVIACLSYSLVESRYKNKKQLDYSDNKKAFKENLNLILIPMGICFCLLFAYQHSYFGLIKKVKSIPYAVDYYGKNCVQKLQNSDYCSFGAEGLRTVLLIGDSHAGDLGTAIEGVARAHNFDLIVFGVYTGCKFQIIDNSKVGIPERCKKLGRKILDYVIKNKPEVVILSQYNKSEFLQSDLQNSILALNEHALNLLVIQTKPVFPDKLDFQVVRPIILGDYSAPRNFEESKMETSNLQVQKDTAVFLQQNKIAHVDFRSVFCPDKICTRFSNGHWLYFDVDHFSIEGAELTKPFFQQFLSSGIAERLEFFNSRN